ncbi:MAG: tyrosine-type recombinase/integrase, partial [Actinomycetota bacterium]|nr:tyrosine-type recombinase/integrase [Actinomycetota bacterium]
ARPPAAGITATPQPAKTQTIRSASYARRDFAGALGPGDLLAAWRTGGRGGWKPFLHHVSRGKPYRGRAITLKAPKKPPRILTVAETQAILDACTRLRDRFFFALIHETGCRAGEVLGLRHEDIAAAECEVSVVPRENANGARVKSGGRTVPVGPELIRLYADYLHEEYGGTDSDYVFVNIWAEPKGQAWSYPAVYDLVVRLRARTGLDFDPHWFRHSAATRWLRDGVSIEVVSKLLGHSSVTTTSATYGQPGWTPAVTERDRNRPHAGPPPQPGRPRTPSPAASGRFTPPSR